MPQPTVSPLSGAVNLVNLSAMALRAKVHSSSAIARIGISLVFVAISPGSVTVLVTSRVPLPMTDAPAKGSKEEGGQALRPPAEVPRKY